MAAKKELVRCTNCPAFYSRAVFCPSMGNRKQLCRRCSRILSLTGGTSFSLEGENNPGWRGGHRYWQPGKYGRDKEGLSWKIQRRLAWERDLYTCQDCGRTKEQTGRNPDVDHEIPYRLSFSHALTNLKCRCRSCHKRVEAQRKELWGGEVFGVLVRPTPKKCPCSTCGSTRRKLREKRCLSCHHEEVILPEVKRLRYEEGKPLREIAPLFGVSMMAVSIWLRKAAVAQR